MDVDGDGVYEIITSGATYTNRETIIYKLDSGKFEEKQFCGCGT